MRSALFPVVAIIMAVQGLRAMQSIDNEALQSSIEWRLDSIFHYSSLAYVPKYTNRLTERDYREVAAELGIDVAAIKAVVEIETGKNFVGFSKSGLPLINFDAGIFQHKLSKLGITKSKVAKQYHEAFSPLNVTRHGGFHSAQHARFEAACGINRQVAIESTFWGMFQIGGFNWRRCGAESCEEFVEMMSRSERDQLELFARFLENCNLTDLLREKKWAEFARKYNGPKYKEKGYDRRLAAAYKKYSKQ